MKNFVLIVLLLLGFSQAPVAASPICISVYSKSNFNLNANSSAIQTIEKNGFLFKLLKVSGLDKASHAYQLAEYYVNDFFPESLRTLNKGKEFEDSIRKNNAHLMNQFHILLMYESGKSEQVVAGAAFVVAKDRNEALAFEKELDLDPTHKLLDPLYPKVEVARVGIDPNVPEASEKFRILIHTIMDVVRSSDDIKSFYAFTSKIHKRMYARLGYDSTTLADAQSLDQLQPIDLILKIDLQK